MHSLRLALAHLLLLGSTVYAATQCAYGPTVMGMSSPKLGDELLVGKEYTVNWDTSSLCAYNSTSSNRTCLQDHIPTGTGIVVLELMQYFALPESPNYCTNLTDALAIVTWKTDNTGSTTWTPPSNISSDHNYLISGFAVWPEKEMVAHIQSGLFTILQHQGDSIPSGTGATATGTGAASGSSASATTSASASSTSGSKGAAARPVELSMGRILEGVFLSGVLSFFF